MMDKIQNPFVTRIAPKPTRFSGRPAVPAQTVIPNGASNDTFVRQPAHPIQHKDKNVRFGISGIDPDFDRFQRIIRDKAREDLKKFINPEKMNIVKGGKVVQLPKPRIDQPHFTRGTPQEGEGGVGSGDGDEGDQIGQVGQGGQAQKGEKGEGQEGEGEGQEAGEGEGKHGQDQWGPAITRSEIARMLMKDLTLPNLQPKGSENVKQTDVKWTQISKVGEKFLPRQTLKNAIKRTILENNGPVKPEDVVVETQDIRYRSWDLDEKPQANAVIFYLMDVSGSMSDAQKEMARTASFYLSTIIQHQFGQVNADLRGETFSDEDFGDGVEEVFVTHDTVAKEVSEKEFYNTRESGGTKISSGYEKIEEIIRDRYPPNEWNIYIFHYSDGDNWGDDDKKSVEIINRLLPKVNEVGYIQTTSSYGSGQFKKVLADSFGDKHVKVRVSQIDKNQPDEYAGVIKKMLSETNDGSDKS